MPIFIFIYEGMLEIVKMFKFNIKLCRKITYLLGLIYTIIVYFILVIIWPLFI